jgi:hypothetical protein
MDPDTKTTLDTKTIRELTDLARDNLNWHITFHNCGRFEQADMMAGHVFTILAEIDRRNPPTHTESNHAHTD